MIKYNVLAKTVLARGTKEIERSSAWTQSSARSETLVRSLYGWLRLLNTAVCSDTYSTADVSHTWIDHSRLQTMRPSKTVTRLLRLVTKNYSVFEDGRSEKGELGLFGITVNNEKSTELRKGGWASASWIKFIIRITRVSQCGGDDWLTNKHPDTRVEDNRRERYI